MNNLTITLVQPQLHWQDKEANFQHLEELLSQSTESDLIILPEMFSTGFSMDPASHYELPGGEGLQWMKNMAARHEAAICGSLIVKEEENYFNRLYFVIPGGEVYHYDKRHLFTLAGEQHHYSAGKKQLIVEYKGWKIFPLVCYDLRFPVWCRNTAEADLMIFVANWPERREKAWQNLLMARSIENMCYVAGVNRVGEDGNEVNHSGRSAVHDELGEILLDFQRGEEGVKSITLEKAKIYESRKKLSFLQDRDQFSLHL